MASKMETKHSHPTGKSKKHANKKRTRNDEDAGDSALLDDKTKRHKKAHKPALDTSKPDVEAKKTDAQDPALLDKSKRSNKAHKPTLDAPEPGVEAKKADVIPAVSTLPVVDQQTDKSANPEKKNKKKNKSQKVLDPISGKWIKKAGHKPPIEQRMLEMANLMNKTSKQSSGQELAKYTTSDELQALASAITTVKQVKPKKKKTHSTVRMLPDAEKVSQDEIITPESQVAAVDSSTNPTSTSMLPVTAITQFMNDLENVFMQFKMRYASELTNAAEVDSKVGLLVAKNDHPAEQEKLPAKLLKKESVDSTNGGDADWSDDESSEDDKLDDSHSSNTLVGSY